MPYRMTPSVRHRAIEVHYYYYYYVSVRQILYCSPVFMITMINATDAVLFARLRVIIIFD